MRKCVYACLFLLLLAPSAAFAQTENAPPPLRRVTLYKHGVGYFERQGKVTGDQQLTFLFDAAQMNDVLKSLVVLDLGKGKISSVTFDSTKPVDKRLEEFGIALDSSNGAGLTSLLGQLRGARVEVRGGAASTASTTGTVVGIEKRSKTQGAEKIESQELVLVSEGGELRSLALDQVRGIKLLDAKLRDDLDQYLSILQSTLHKNLRRLTIAAMGQGERDLFVSYVVEAPIWKATYRVVLDAKTKPFLQGWALIDNVQDEDWNDVRLSLVSGAPISFIQDLQQPLYKRRPVVGMPEDVSVAPQIPQAAMSRSTLNLVSASRGGVIEGTIADPNGAAIAGATVKLTHAESLASISATTNSDGEYRLRGLPPGSYTITVENRGFQKTVLSDVNVAIGKIVNQDLELRLGSVTETVTITSKSETINTESASIGSARAMRDAESGVDIHVDTQEIGELFEYRIAHPVTIKRNSSALIPILQNQVEGESVSLYNKSVREQNPMSALYLTNNTGLTLESGPLTIIENETYAGEALTGRIKPNEKRFITYAVDLGCRVSVKEDQEAQRAFLAEITNGDFRVHYQQTRTTIYTFNNLSGGAKTVYIEHPYDKDSKWQLTKTDKPAETTEKFHRFKVIVPANTTSAFPVTEELPEVNSFALSNITSSNIELFVQSNYLTPQMKQALDGIANLKTGIAALARQLVEKTGEINALAKDQERVRENLRALGKTVDEKQLVQRYVAKLAQGEDQLERLRLEEKKLKDERENLQRQLDDRIRKLAMEHRLN